MRIGLIACLILVTTAAGASPKFTCDRAGFKLDGKRFVPTGACYAVVTDVDFAGKYKTNLIDRDLDICRDLNINTLLVFADYKSFEPTDDRWSDAYVSNWDDFIDRAYRRGIYIAVATTNWPADFEFAKLSPSESPARSDQRYTDAILLKETGKWTTQFLTRLRNRDKLFAWVIYAEPATNAWANEDAAGSGFMSSYMKSGVMQRWHAYLRREYRSFDELKKAWSLNGSIQAFRPQEKDFATVRPAFEGDIHYYADETYPRSWRRSEDYQRFLAEEYARNVDYLCEQVKAVDRDLLVCNSLLPVLLPVLRSYKWSRPEAHHGIAYPERLVEPDVKTDFTAIRFSPDMDAWSESLSGPSVPIEYKLTLGLPAAVWYLKHLLDDANKPLMFFDLDNADFGDWNDKMMRDYTAQELPLAFFAGAKGYLWWCFKSDPSVKRPYGLVNNDRTPTSRYNVVKDFNKWIADNYFVPNDPLVTVILNETDGLVDPWDTWASLELLSASMLNRGISFEVITLDEFLSDRKSRGYVVWLRNGFADAHPGNPGLRRLMSDPKKKVLVIGVDRYLSTWASDQVVDILESSVNVFPSEDGRLEVLDTPFRPKPPFLPSEGSRLSEIRKPAFIADKYGILYDRGRKVAKGVGQAVAKVTVPDGGGIVPLLKDADGNPLVVTDRKSRTKSLLLLQPQAIWYAYQEPGALDLIPDLLGLTHSRQARGLFRLRAQPGYGFVLRAFGEPGRGAQGLTFDDEGRLAPSGRPLEAGQVKILVPAR